MSMAVANTFKRLISNAVIHRYNIWTTTREREKKRVLVLNAQSTIRDTQRQRVGRKGNRERERGGGEIER